MTDEETWLERYIDERIREYEERIRLRELQRAAKRRRQTVPLWSTSLAAMLQIADVAYMFRAGQVIAFLNFREGA